MDENRAKILQGLVCETPNCCETLFDSCDLCKQGLCEVCYQGYHLCINDEDFGDVNSDGNLVAVAIQNFAITKHLSSSYLSQYPYKELVFSIVL